MKIYKWFAEYIDDFNAKNYNVKDRFAIVNYHCDNKINIYKNYILILKDFPIKYEDIKNLTEDKVKKLLMLKE